MNEKKRKKEKEWSEKKKEMRPTIN